MSCLGAQSHLGLWESDPDPTWSAAPRNLLETFFHVDTLIASFFAEQIKVSAVRTRLWCSIVSLDISRLSYLSLSGLSGRIGP